MENVFWVLLTLITKIVRAFLALLYMAWKFELNPTVKEGKLGCEPCTNLDYKLWDWVFIKARKRF